VFVEDAVRVAVRVVVGVMVMAVDGFGAGVVAIPVGVKRAWAVGAGAVTVAGGQAPLHAASSSAAPSQATMIFPMPCLCRARPCKRIEICRMKHFIAS
jgi:hypothetical protein